MPITRRGLLQIAALALAEAGCSNAPDKGTAAPPATHPAPPASPAASPSARPAPTRPAGPAVEVGHGPRTSKTVALTFHGAGDAGIARAVLDELHRAGARATVLAVGTWLDAEPAMARQVLDGGHELGNHTQSHLPMRWLAAATAYREIAGCAHRLRRLTGTPGRWFRPSGTQHTTPTIRAAAARAGYPTCLSYDVDSLDWTDPGPAAVVRQVLGSATGGSIVSLHLGHRGTVAAIPPLLDGLHRRGLKPVTVSELLA
jgi:peptidoglycan/xylan/chitin deacetylase (PgdA/CDA1 family)